MARWLAVALGAILGCMSSSCAGEPEAVAARPSHHAIRYGGYFDRRAPDAPRFAWPGAHLTARFSGTSLRARLTSTPVADETREADWIEVVIDDQPPKTLALAEGEHVYTLAEGLPPGAHRALIWKRTEAAVGTITFHGFVLAPGGALGPPLPEPRRRMIFVGDSITAGYGNEGPGDPCAWSAAYENNHASYGAVAARLLDAEYVATAWSGKGIVRNYDAHDRETMPELYRRVIPTEPGSPATPALRADAVVVNLGTNDFGRGAPDAAATIAAFERLAGELRGRHPDALLVLALGPMVFDGAHGGVPARSLLRAWLDEVRSRRAAQGDQAVALLELWSDPAEGLGCDGHPSARTHARLGAELAALVKRKLGW